MLRRRIEVSRIRRRRPRKRRREGSRGEERDER